MTLLGLVACAAPSGSGAPTPRGDAVPPVVTDYELDCDVDASRWTVMVEASAWSGGVTTWWTVDGAYVERHRIPSVAYEEDGSGESFELTLPVVSDWRAQVDGSSTAFLCASNPDVLLSMDDLDGGQADCITQGPDPSRWAGIDGVPACDEG